MKSNPSHYLNFYRDRSGEYRWKVRARNGNIVAESGEGYHNVAGCMKGFDSLARAIIIGRLDIRDYIIRSYEEHMRRLTLDQTLQIEKDNVKLKATVERLTAELAEARGEKPAPKPVVEEIAEDTTRKPRGKGSE